MCSLKDIDDPCESLIFAEKPVLNDCLNCRSCDQKALVVLRKKDAYCRECFLAAQTHKFRATLGKSKMMRPQDKVLVAYSGSQSCAALLHLLHSGVTENEHKKLLFNVCVLYIEEGVLFNQSKEERMKIVEEIKKSVVNYDFPFFVTTCGETFKDEPVIDEVLKISNETDFQLTKLFENIQSVSSKEDLLYLLKKKLLLKVAHQLNCNKIFTSEIASDLAVKLLTNFSSGRGDQAAFETSFCDSRHSTKKILRPLKDFTSKEVAFYNVFHQIEAVNSLSLTTKCPYNISIKKLTEKFITNLQEDFPSTIYTIYKTGEKLGTNLKSDEEDNQDCIICEDKIRFYNTKSKYSAVEAAEFSRNVSRKKQNKCEMLQKNGCCGSCSNEKDISKIEMEKYLCYGCAIIVRDLNAVECLPKNLIATATERRDFESMKEQISNFLIESPEIEV